MAITAVLRGSFALLAVPLSRLSDHAEQLSAATGTATRPVRTRTTRAPRERHTGSDLHGSDDDGPQREQNAIEVTLHGDRATHQAVVVMWNWNSGVCLQMEADAQRAGYAFAHPYAIAAAFGAPASDNRHAA